MGACVMLSGGLCSRFVQWMQLWCAAGIICREMPAFLSGYEFRERGCCRARWLVTFARKLLACLREHREAPLHAESPVCGPECTVLAGFGKLLKPVVRMR